MREELNSLKIYHSPALDVLNLGNNENFYSDWNTSLITEITEMIKKCSFLNYGPAIHQGLVNRYSQYINVSSDKIMLGPGSESLIPLLFNALTENSTSGKILSPDPDFFRYKEIALVLNRQMLHVPFNEEDNIIEQLIEKANREQVEMIILSNPNNPLGRIYSREDLIRLLENTHCYVVVDEAYAEFCGESLADLIEQGKYPQLVILRTLSKAFGIANLRIGFALAAEKIIQFLIAVQGPFVVSEINANIAGMVLEHTSKVEEQVRLICEERDSFIQYLTSFPHIKVYESHANFVYFIHPENKHIRQKLLKYKIAVSFFEPDAIRLTIGTREQMKYVKLTLGKILSEL
ncbi:histidinol-phosphate transaminase [Lactovum odontotermitis]